MELLIPEIIFLDSLAANQELVTNPCNGTFSFLNGIEVISS